MEIVIILFALSYSAAVLFALAWALRARLGARRAAWSALGISAALHAATLLLVPADQRGFFLAFWAVPHLLLAPLLLLAARHRS
ncbi:MAG: hypothetical protein RMK64_00735 [Rhodovarius sp.]|nr:hypothetical protein [Rhodovarius sp.]MCX7932102.1 hypothetical protein [Rhodovarius sp.]MDW8313469.1 hypothetical protein [Rhodovarius sp.]